MILTYYFLSCGFHPITLSQEGPIFSDYGDYYGDFLGASGWVNLRVTVNDINGVDVVLGSVRNISDSIWNNVTLEELIGIPNRYSGNFSVVLPEVGMTYTFEVKYYANDSLGNWNVSESKYNYLTNIGLETYQNPLIENLPLIVSIVGITVILIILIRFRKKQQYH
jgi:hypothetical protein